MADVYIVEKIMHKTIKNIFIISGLITLFIILRLAVLFSYLGNLYEHEELYRGTIAREIIQGPLMPLWEYLDYKVEYFPGGILTVGMLTVPFFLLFGQTYIALKLVGLSFAFGTFILWYIFLNIFFNRRTAIICALLFIFCMPFYTKTSLITWGAHPEANFFTVLGIFIFSAIFFQDDRAKEWDIVCLYRNNRMKFLSLGLVSGFGLWFVQTYLLTILFLFLFWFIFDKRLFLRKVFYIYCLGFLIGFGPAIYYALFYKGAIFNVNGRILFNDILLCDLRSIFPRLSLLLTYDLPNSFLFVNLLKLPGKLFSYLYYMIFITALIYLLWFNRPPLLVLLKSLIYPITLKEVKLPFSHIFRESFIITYPLLFFLSYVISGYSVSPQLWKNPEIRLDYIGYRYMIPVIPFILVIMGIFIDRIWNKRLIFNVFLAFALGLGLTGNLSLISLKNFGRFFEDKGYSYNIIGDKIGLRITDNLAEYIKPFDRLEDNLKVQFYEGLGVGLGWRMKDEDIKKVVKTLENEINPIYHHCLYRGWGTLFFPQYPEEYKRALYIANNIPYEYRPFFYEGGGRKMYFTEDLNGAMNFLNDIDNKVEKIYQPYFYIGIGYSIGFEFKTDPDKMNSLINAMDKQYHRFINQGIILGMGER